MSIPAYAAAGSLYRIRTSAKRTYLARRCQHREYARSAEAVSSRDMHSARRWQRGTAATLVALDALLFLDSRKDGTAAPQVEFPASAAPCKA